MTYIGLLTILNSVVVVSIGRLVTIVQAGTELNLDPTCRSRANPHETHHH